MSVARLDLGSEGGVVDRSGGSIGPWRHGWDADPGPMIPERRPLGVQKASGSSIGVRGSLGSMTKTKLPETFRNLPDTSRAWIFAATDAIPAASRERIETALRPTMEKWKSHATEIPAAVAFLDEATLLVAADFTGADMSGCSIDRMIQAVRETGQGAGVELVDTPRGVHHFEPEGMRFSSRTEFGSLVAQGMVDESTEVLDLTLTTLGEVRQDRWKRPAGDGWHRKAYFPAGQATLAR